MIDAIQAYQLNNREIQVNLGEVPKLFPSLKNFLQQELHLYVPDQLIGAELKSRINALPDMMRDIQEAKDSKTKDRLLACLQALLVAASVAALVLCIIYNSPFAILAFLSFYAFSVWGVVDAAEKLNLSESEFDALGLSILIGGGIFVPLYETFSRVSRLEESLDETKKTIEEDLDRVRRENLRLLPENYRFYQRETRRVEEVLTQRIEESEDDFQKMKLLHIRSPKGEEELSTRIETLRKTRENWAQVVAFYNQFNPERVS